MTLLLLYKPKILAPSYTECKYEVVNTYTVSTNNYKRSIGAQPFEHWKEILNSLLTLSFTYFKHNIIC